MSEEFVLQDGEPILVQFSEARGMQPVSLSPHEMAEKSAEALEKAMGTLRRVSDRVLTTIRSIDAADRPAEVVVEFGLQFDAEAGVLVAKAATQASFKVTLTWKKTDEQQQPE